MTKIPEPADPLAMSLTGFQVPTVINESTGGLSTERRQQLNAFIEEIRTILVNGHKEYGETAEAIYRALGPPAGGYAIAEKGIRFAKKGNPVDLVKAATYAFLAWTVVQK